MKRQEVGLLIAAMFCAAVAGCAQQDGVDLAHESQALMEADRAFARDTAERGGDGWADNFAEDAVMFPPSGRIDGNNAIRETMRAVFAPGNPRLLWDPTDAMVSASGDVGYTLGRWQSVGLSVAGDDSVRSQGHYVTIWKKSDDGKWRVAADIGNRDSQ